VSEVTPVPALSRTFAKVPFVGRLLSTWQGWLICSFLAFQLAFPLHYYFSRDPHDERFAWRMFSPMRMTECTYELKVDGTRIDTNREFHEAWNEIARRGRRSVLEAMGQYQCRKNPGKPVTIRLDCKYLDHEPVSYGGFDLCEIPQL
jgi:hypothetical protein